MALVFRAASTLTKETGGPRATLAADRGRAWRRFPTVEKRGRVVGYDCVGEEHGERG